ncbi:MAG: MarC family protein [Candidatus Omnitrophica bacterium]|nr:MarC family protein [Candidatus Omnitrophota bacterium]
MLKNILLAFVPIFVAVDAIGVLPIFIGVTSGLTSPERLKIIKLSLVTALSLAISFIFLGKGLFNLLGITVADFMIAGGAILFCIALTDIFQTEKKRNIPTEEIGAVPIGTPLIVGPAVLTTCLICIGQYGIVPTLIAVFINVLLAGIIFASADILLKFFGRSGAAALSKIMALLLGAIAVMMIRKGIFAFINPV